MKVLLFVTKYLTSRETNGKICKRTATG